MRGLGSLSKALATLKVAKAFFICRIREKPLKGHLVNGKGLRARSLGTALVREKRAVVHTLFAGKRNCQQVQAEQ